MRTFRVTFAAAARTMLTAGLGLAAIASAAAPQQAGQDEFITLGTMRGPIAHPKRSQPANALVVGQDVYLVDVGDGAVQRLAEAGLRLNAVKAIFISHHHFDHTGGLGAVLGLRYQ